ncbi:MAG: hypothetical protein MZV70_76100 [Desulfobacterales bacterium]|nr:hypothetical protein [Desulfobacterales bacterium]
MAVFVDQAVPGDRALIQVTRRKKNFAEARMVEILRPRPRIGWRPPAATAGFCGGCTWQFLRYEQAAGIQAPARGGDPSSTSPRSRRCRCTRPSRRRPIFEYRNKMEFTCTDRRWLLAV